MISSDPTVTQLWSPITLRSPEDGDDTFSKTSVRTRATQYKVPEGFRRYSPQANYTDGAAENVRSE
jgi:hypothetical protein